MATACIYFSDELLARIDYVARAEKKSRSLVICDIVSKVLIKPDIPKVEEKDAHR
jgi:predicted transcriptional regulator